MAHIQYYSLSWTGNGTDGAGSDAYTAVGLFSYPTANDGGIISRDQLLDLDIVFFDPEGNEIDTFNYDFPITGEFNFNFDSATGEILQSGNFDDLDNGFDLGIDFEADETGLDFYSDNRDVTPATIMLDNIETPGVDENAIDQGGVLEATKIEEIITKSLFWRGDAGYTAEGSFRYDASLEGGLVTEEQLINLEIAFFDPQRTELESFDYDFFGGEFNFSYDSATGEILQSGNFDDDDGFDLGIDFEADETGLDFYSDNRDVTPAIIVL